MPEFLQFGFMQRAFAAGRDVVMAGRDIGTVVLPRAGFKFYLTASIDARVDRRLRELHVLGVAIDRETLRAEIVARDKRDTTRAVAPLKTAPDAHLLDTTHLDIDAAFRAAIDIVEAVRAGRVRG